MGLDAINDQPELQALRLRIERLEREVLALQQQRDAATLPQARSTASDADLTHPPIQREVRATPPPFTEAPPPPKPSIENRIGSQWFSRIGISALLIATALFLKLAFDNHWIGPLGRTLAGLIAGAALILWSERFRRQGVAAFSYALKALGSGILYLTLWAAFQLYALLPAPVAFGAMLLVTAWNAWMAWAQDAELLAAYALIGAFATPALLTTGVTHETFLFSYLLVIDLAIVALVRMKPWPRLLLAAFLPNALYYITWYVFARQDDRPFPLTTLFVGLFFVVFASAGTRLFIRDRVQPAAAASTIADALLPLANAFFTALALYTLLEDNHRHAWTPWIALLLAVFYLGLVRVSRSATAAAVHLSLAILFLTVAIPLKATGRAIVIGWFVEGVALLWASARLADQQAPSRIRTVLRWLACTALALGFISVLSTSAWSPLAYSASPFLNQRFATGLVAALACGLATWIALSAHRKQLATDTSTPAWIHIAAVAVIAFNLVTLWSVVQEIDSLWRHGAALADAGLQRNLAVSGFLMAYGAALLAAGFWSRRAFVRWQALILLVFTIGKTFLYDMSSLSQGYRVASFFALGALLMAISFAYQKNWLGLREVPPAVQAAEVHEPQP